MAGAGAAAAVRTESRVFLYSAVEIMRSPVASFFLVGGAMMWWIGAWAAVMVIEERVLVRREWESEGERGVENFGGCGLK
jgi:hypothetical protein